MTILESIGSVRESFRADLDSFPTDQREIDLLRSKYFGRKGLLADLYILLSGLSNKEKPKAGQSIKSLKKELQKEFDRKTASIASPKQVTNDQLLDLSLPG